MTHLHFFRSVTLNLIAVNLLSVLAALLLTGAVFLVREHRRLTEMYAHQLTAIASTAAVHLSGEMGDAHEQLRDDSSLGSVLWARWRGALQAIQQANGLREDLYTFRRTASPEELRFVARSYDPPAGHAGPFVGEPYHPIDPGQREAVQTALTRGVTTHTGIYQDSLSDRRWITSYAPIRDSAGKTVGLLDVDVDARDLHTMLRSEMHQFLLFAGGLMVGALILSSLLARRLTRPIRSLVGAARALGRGDYDCPIKDAPNDEIGELARAFCAMRRDLRRAQREAMDNLRLSTVGRMASGIIHDFKGPMTAISGYAELMTTPGFDEPQREGFRQSILRNIDVMVEMTHDLLDYSRGQASLNATEVSVPRFISDLVQTAEPAMSKAGITLCVENDCDGEALIDAVKMRRVIFNLLTNAREAIGPGGEIHLVSHVRGDVWRIEVRDTGPGIPNEVRDRLFEPFATHGKARGTGLGLALAKQFVEQHRGQITVQSAKGQGTSFQVEIPVELSVAAQAA